MKRVVSFMFGVFFLSVVVASAQTQATGASRFAWDQPNLSAAEAQLLTYNLRVDGSTTPVVLSNVSCLDVAGVTVCGCPIPAFTPGNHTSTVSAQNVAGESLPSNVLTFQFIIVPNAPVNFRLL